MLNSVFEKEMTGNYLKWSFCESVGFKAIVSFFFCVWINSIQRDLVTSPLDPVTQLVQTFNICNYINNLSSKTGCTCLLGL